MKILEELETYLGKINQEPLNQEKENLEIEINFLVEEVNRLQKQIIESNSLDSLNESSLEEDLNQIVSKIQNLLSINTHISQLHDQVITLEKSSSQKQAKIFQIQVDIEEIIQQESENYIEFQLTDEIECYTQYVNQFKSHLDSIGSTKILNKINGRIQTMQKTAERLKKTNKQLNSAMAKLENFKEQITQAGFNISSHNIETSNIYILDVDTQEISHSFKELHAKNLDKIQKEQEEKLQQEQKDFEQKVSDIKTNLKLNVLYLKLPILLLAVFSHFALKDYDQAQDKDQQVKSVNLLNKRLTDYINSDLDKSEKELIYFQRILIDSLEPVVSTKSLVTLYSFKGETKNHYVLFTDEVNTQTFSIDYLNDLDLKDAVDSVFGPHNSLDLVKCPPLGEEVLDCRYFYGYY
ncbi:hypothetical protein CL656_02835 [bacterium]|nr:hypothetical protein [bacterium]|tara:strand:- start:6734 stop:7960 length:1227 start_codon:yes stop_codon:yes gene_type:complete